MRQRKIRETFREGPGTGANWFTWTPTLASAGGYRVYARSVVSGDSTQAKYRVFPAVTK